MRRQLEALGLVDGGELDRLGIGIDLAVAGLAVEQDDLREQILHLLEAAGEADDHTAREGVREPATHG